MGGLTMVFWEVVSSYTSKYCFQALKIVMQNVEEDFK